MTFTLGHLTLVRAGGRDSVAHGEKEDQPVVDRCVVDSWERQDGESRQAFEAFAVYRDLGPARSVTKVARELGKSRTLLGRWSRQYAWVMRSVAYDREQDRLFLAEQAQARREIARRHAELAQAVQSKAVARLQALDPRELSPSELLRYIQVAVEIGRRAVGEAPSPAVTAEAQEQGADVAALADEERRARMDQLRRDLERRPRARSDPGAGETPDDRELRRPVGDELGAAEGGGRRAGPG
ncbi:hypothetical protein AB5J72_47965 [Streptomyces sp. CG1]|uniref:hypothetical protein n=1 Tax=Streptomyces sp. CG1 TaxID=1287523 RepID=UPI0034E1AD6D